MAKKYIIAAIALVAINMGAAAQVSNIDDCLNNRLSKESSAQSNVYGEKIVVGDQVYDLWTRVQTGFYAELRGGGKYTTGVFSPAGEALVGYRFTWGDIAGYAGMSQHERNGADVNAGEKYLSMHMGAELAVKILEDHSGKYLGDWRLSLVGRLGAQSFKHDEATDEFTLHDGSNYIYTFGETGLSLVGALGLRHEVRLSKANALFLTVQGLVEYTNDPKINDQVKDKVGGELTIGFKYVFGKKKYTSYGEQLRKAGLL